MRDELRDKNTLLFLSASQSRTNVAAICTEKAGFNVTASPMAWYLVIILLFIFAFMQLMSDK